MFDFFKKKNKDEEIENKKLEKDSLENEETSDQLEENNENDVEVNFLEIEKISSNNFEEKKDEDEDLGFFAKLSKGLSKTREQFSSNLKNLFTANVKIDDDLYDELEEILISADIGMQSTIEIVDQLKDEIKERSIKNSEEIFPLLKEIMEEKLDEKNLENKLNVSNDKLSVILVIGVNGVGKTTTIGKLAYNLKKEGHKVTLAAADTFRAAAIEQLTEWSNRAKVDIISHKEGADPASVVFDGVNAMKSRNTDILICDTAGRLHNKKNLMNELNKIKRVIEKEYPEAKKEILLIVDGTTGQNAIIQAKEFMNATDLTGAIITKLDGTAKGGMIFPLEMELGIPVKFIGIGEQVNDLVKFEPEKFIEAIIN